ncbi:uncharacterized protein [Palaemon carinicauda]|uniref:uncharacterized protein isoform X1 n=1 Tax=Palaemon carinicauda TaxID=392227 RepID=UPI0035B64871
MTRSFCHDVENVRRCTRGSGDVVLRRRTRGSGDVVLRRRTRGSGDVVLRRRTRGSGDVVLRRRTRGSGDVVLRRHGSDWRRMHQRGGSVRGRSQKGPFEEKLQGKGALRSGLNVRCASSTPGHEEAVVITNDGRTIVAWHPEPQIPYEMTMPLPEQFEADTIIKVEDANAMKKLFRHQHPFFVRKELQDLTYTTKHPWFPSVMKKYLLFKSSRTLIYLSVRRLYSSVSPFSSETFDGQQIRSAGP